MEVQELRIIPVSKAVKYPFLAVDEGMKLRQIGILGGFFVSFVNGVKGLSKLFVTVVFGGRTSHRGMCVCELLAYSF